jgi:hypothetical protein
MNVEIAALFPEKEYISGIFVAVWYSLAVPNLILEPVEPGPDGHGLDVAPLVHAVVVAAWLSQRLVQPPLQLLHRRH